MIAHKKVRRISLGPHATLVFEDFTTMKYQVQEMLRVERIFEAEGIEDEIAAYNPLIPDGNNWKATFMIEYEDVAERRTALAQMIGIEHRVWVRIGDSAPLFALANEDLPRSNDEKTAAVHFLRFDIPPAQIASAKAGAPIAIGIDHPALPCRVDPIPEPVRASLVSDLDLNRLMGGLGQRIARYIAAPAKYYKPTVVSGGEVRWPDFIQPCDVLLVEGSSRISTAIKYLTQSTWSHSAICVGGAAPFPLVEADVEFGVSSVPYQKYVDANVRICRPVG